jgi:hypothetical protein
MNAWMLAPPTPLGEAAARLLATEGWDVARIPPGTAPPETAPDLVLLLHWEPVTWSDVSELLGHARNAPAIYIGPFAGEAQEADSRIDVAFRSLRGATLRLALEQLGLPWGPARAPGA